MSTTHETDAAVVKATANKSPITFGDSGV